jgi:hypothetical protein
MTKLTKSLVWSRNNMLRTQRNLRKTCVKPTWPSSW